MLHHWSALGAAQCPEPAEDTVQWNWRRTSDGSVTAVGQSASVFLIIYCWQCFIVLTFISIIRSTFSPMSDYYLIEFRSAHWSFIDTSESPIVNWVLFFLEKQPTRLRGGVYICTAAELHAHMHSPACGHSANFKVRCVHGPGAKTICQGAYQSLSTSREAVTGNSLGGKWASETHLQTSPSSSWFSSSAQRSGFPSLQTDLLNQCIVIPPTVKRFSTPTRK